MKLLRNTLMLITLGLMSVQCAQTNAEQTQEEIQPTYSFAEGHALVWSAAIDQLMELADAMPEDMYTYQPHDSVRTFAEQLVHIGGSSLVIANLYLNDVPPGDSPRPDASSMSKEDIKALIRTNLEQVGKMISESSDEKLAEKIKSFGGNEMTRLEGLLTVHDHMTNHKAKANLYVRISGNTPPAYRYY